MSDEGWQNSTEIPENKVQNTSQNGEEKILKVE